MPKGIPNKKPVAAKAAATKKRRRKKRRTGVAARGAKAGGMSISHEQLGTVVGHALKAVLNN